MGTKKKTTTVDSYDVTVLSSSFKTGGNLNVDSANDINIVGSNITAGKDSNIKAEGNYNVVTVNDEHYFSKETKKSGFGPADQYTDRKRRRTLYMTAM